tara:strand:- start:867 stop:1841 length:975 start_codon:yes stop_codon:yes gene_type:complete
VINIRFFIEWALNQLSNNLKTLILFLLFFIFSFSAKTDDYEYTKDIHSSTFIEFEDSDYRNIILKKNINIIDTENRILFIYTPGSMNDDRIDGVCSTFNEFAYLTEFFYEFKKTYNIYFYLNCTNHIHGDMKIPNASNFPFPYRGISKHQKIRENLASLVKEFKKKGFDRNNIFLVGHSCGAWHSLFAASQNYEFVNSVIAFSPSCFGPRYLYFQRRGFLKQRKQDIKKISKSNFLSSIVFVSPDDVRENNMTLKWLKKIDGVKVIKTFKRKNRKYIFNSLQCNFHSDFNVDEIPIIDGHNLHFSNCFKKYNSEIFDFIKSRIS